MTTADIDSLVDRFVKEILRQGRQPIAVMLSEAAHRDLLKKSRHEAYRAMQKEPTSLKSIGTVAGPLPVRVVRKSSDLWDLLDTQMSVGVVWDDAVQA